MRRADADALSVLSTAKLDQVTALQAIARARTQQMKRAGLPASAAGVKAWIAGSPEVSATQESWDKLLRLALEAKHQNEVNGRLAARQRWHFDAALGALLQAAGVASLYGSDGRARRTSVPQSHLAV